MMHKMAIVIDSHNTPTTEIAIAPTTPPIPSTFARVMSHSTSDS